MKELIESWTQECRVVEYDGTKRSLVHIEIKHGGVFQRMGFYDLDGALVYTLDLVKNSVRRTCNQIEYEKR